MGELMREQQERPHGKRIAQEQAARRRGGGAGAEDPGVAGFPGMGKRSAPRAVPHLHRKVEEASALPPTVPPWAQHDDIVEPERRRNGGQQPAAPAAPAYRIDEADYEDRRLEQEDGVGAYHDHQRRMQEIEMYDDGDDEGYDIAPQRGGAGGAGGAQAHPEWLDEDDLAH